MLSLTRQKDESIMIGDNVEIKILHVSSGGFVKLGIEAPREIPVHRMEIWVKIQKEKEKGDSNGAVINLSSSTR